MRYRGGDIRGGSREGALHGGSSPLDPSNIHNIVLQILYYCQVLMDCLLKRYFVVDMTVAIHPVMLQSL